MVIKNIKKAHIEAFFEEAFREALNIGIDKNITHILSDLSKNLDSVPVDFWLFDKTLKFYRKYVAQKNMHEGFLQEMVWQATIQDKKNNIHKLQK